MLSLQPSNHHVHENCLCYDSSASQNHGIAEASQRIDQQKSLKYFTLVDYCFRAAAAPTTDEPTTKGPSSIFRTATTFIARAALGERQATNHH
jgi:hypothetical protein